MRRIRVTQARTTTAVVQRFSECEYRPTRSTETVADDKDACLSAVMHQIQKRLRFMVVRWLIPANVFTKPALYRFVLENLLHESLLYPTEPFRSVVSNNLFSIVHTPSAGGAGNMLELVLGSPEYSARRELMLGLVDSTLEDVLGFLSEAMQHFIDRCVKKATPPESGLLSKQGPGSVFVLRVLYGSFAPVTPSIKKWEISLFAPSDDPRTVYTGILRLLLMKCHEYRFGITAVHDAAQVIASFAAKLFVDELSFRFMDSTCSGFLLPISRVDGVMMRRDSQHLVTLLSDVFGVDKSFVVHDIIENRALVPHSVTNFVNVAFVVENVMFALQHETLTVPPRMVSSYYSRMRAKHSILARTRLRKALALALASPNGVSTKAFKAFAYSCGTSSKVFVHMFRAFHILMQGVMAKHIYGRRELSCLERAMTDVETAENVLFSRGEYPPGPWKHVIRYLDDDSEDGSVICMANLVEEFAHAAQNGTPLRQAWVKKDALFLQSTVPSGSWDYEGAVPLPDTGAPCLQRLLDAFVDLKQLNASRGATPGKTVFGDTDASGELVNVAFGVTVPNFAHVVNSLCYSRDKREMAASMLPVFVLIWNAALTLRQRLRERSVAVDPVGSSKKRVRVNPDEPVKSCLACMDVLPSHKSVDMGCSHCLCMVCASALLESRIRAAFVGKGAAAGAGITCCPDARCSGKITDASVPNLLPPELYAVLLHLKKAEEVHEFFCSACGLPPVDFNSARDGAVFMCTACGMGTCSQCDRAAHFGEACLKKRDGMPTPEDLLSQAKIQKCPKCATPEVKRRNCNHVFCKDCETDWCWACAKILDSKDVTSHYSEESPVCVTYSTKTETDRMKRALKAMETPETKAVVQYAMDLLSSSALQQTEADI
jgi:hypothetical protein